MSIVKSSKGKDQLLFEGFRYRRANKRQVTWRCVRNSCSGCITLRNDKYLILTDQIHAQNPEELVSIERKAKINENASTSNAPPRKIIHEALLSIQPDDALSAASYSVVHRTVERKCKKIIFHCQHQHLLSI